MEENETNKPAEEQKPEIDRGAIHEAVVDELKSCYDPEIPVNIYELGLIYGIVINDDSSVDVVMTLTSPACPVAGSLPPEVESRVKAIPGVKDCRVRVVWEPMWGVEMMSDEARLMLGL
jgi:FeS assembly SUF system protein